MRGTNHIALALAVPAVAITLHPPAIIPSAFEVAINSVALVIGSLGPDIDNAGLIARPSNILPKILPRFIGKTLDWLGTTFSGLVRFIFGHRGLTHYPLIGLALAGVGYFMGLSWLMWFGIGWLLHLLGDIITIEGVPLFGPLSRKKVSLFPLRVGGTAEGLVGAGLWLVLVGLVIKNIMEAI